MKRISKLLVILYAAYYTLFSFPVAASEQISSDNSINLYCHLEHKIQTIINSQLDELSTELGLSTENDVLFYIQNVVSPNGQEIPVLCYQTIEGSLVNETIIISEEIDENGNAQLLNAAQYLQRINADRSINSVINEGHLLSNVYATATFEKTTKSGNTYYRPQKLSYRVGGSSAPSTVTVKYSLRGYPHTLTSYEAVDPLIHGDYLASHSTSNPSIGITYSRTAYSSYRYILSGVPGVHHRISVSTNGSLYQTADITG